LDEFRKLERSRRPGLSKTCQCNLETSHQRLRTTPVGPGYPGRTRRIRGKAKTRTDRCRCGPSI
ncbi:uncharacterized protein METZ01_LOCUS335437, partial [marine metagenome]